MRIAVLVEDLHGERRRVTETRTPGIDDPHRQARPAAGEGKSEKLTLQQVDAIFSKTRKRGGKDGPSAGVTMASAVVSVLSGRPVRHDLAMTGEITLSGRVLPIGGLKEKILGAVRAGITEILLPKENESDLEDLPVEVRERIRVHAVDELGAVLAIALRGASLREGRLHFQDDEAGITTVAAARPGTTGELRH